MARKKAKIKKEISKKSYKEKKKESYKIRKDIYFDEITYQVLLELVADCNYDVKNKKTSEGIAGVIAMALDGMHKNFKKIKNPQETQILILLAREVLMYLNAGYKIEKICKIFNKNKAFRYQCPNSINKSKEWEVDSILMLLDKYCKKYGEPSSFETSSGEDFELTKKDIEDLFEKHDYY